MAAMFKVLDGVPLPPINRAPKVPHRKFPVQGMSPGQAFLMPGRKIKSVTAYISRITKDLPGTYTTRHCWMWQDQRDLEWRLCEQSSVGAVEGVGVWRTE